MRVSPNNSFFLSETTGGLRPDFNVFLLLKLINILSDTNPKISSKIVKSQILMLLIGNKVFREFNLLNLGYDLSHNLE